MVDYSKPMKPLGDDNDPENRKRALFFVHQMMREIDDSINQELLVKTEHTRAIQRRIMKLPHGDYVSLDVSVELEPDPEGCCWINYQVARRKQEDGADSLAGKILSQGPIPIFATGMTVNTAEDIAAHRMVDYLPDELKAPHILDYPEKDSELSL
ncbi:hypothetical protein [Corynebacterium minutissimum]|uniref:Uncharacterized protein n=1 Tax=Corynebacterium minutissimum TaxID=38301 RepID=A0A376CWS5_9CORY|nr:hypothetical protein [Corynebacterium minutissimum]QRP60656.1 hypothetical protein I6J26_10970 [Corynebacterium minutissimum]STC76715.1 Uncharacterised protein [Corynebacterium minutissimum]